MVCGMAILRVTGETPHIFACTSAIAFGLHHVADLLLFNARQYCTRKLRRLYKALKFTHGRGKYASRKLDASTVTDVG
jgi:hypothetical protein